MSYTTDLQSNNVDLQNILNTVNALPEKIQLPELTNPAGAENIEVGYEAIDGLGAVIIGTSNKKDMVYGLFTVPGRSTVYNITIPEIAGKSNFILCACHSGIGYGTQIIVAVFSGEINNYRYRNGSSISVNEGALTFDTESGKITDNRTWGFESGRNYFYVAW